MSPVFKKDDLLTNYRVTSVLQCFSKLLERIMYNRPFKYLSENSILYEKKFGFQTAHSTECAIMQLANQIYQSFDNNKFTLRIFVDLNKAFDTEVTIYLDPMGFVYYTNLFYSHKNIKPLFQIVNNEIKFVYESFVANKLSLNEKS